MKDNEHIITQFYAAFQQLDANGMAACYHENVRFEDPAFGVLNGSRAGAMWQMLCSNARDLKIEFGSIEVNGNMGKAKWEAWYTFSKTGRKVHNSVSAYFEFKDGKIISHQDEFNLWRWAGQALGIQGYLLGGTRFFRSKLQAQTNKTLNRFIDK